MCVEMELKQIFLIILVFILDANINKGDE